MNRDNYIGGSISTRIRENNLLTSNDLERLNDYNSVEDVLNALSDSSYRDAIQNLNRPEEYEKILDEELKNSYDLIENTAGDDNILQYFRERYNFHNLKVLVREIAQDESYANLYNDIGNIDLAYIKRHLSNDNIEVGFLEGLEIEGYEPFNKSVNENDTYVEYGKKALAKFRETNNPKDIDITLDKAYYEKLLIDAKEIDLEELTKYTKERIDLINIKTLLRIKAQGNEASDLSEALIDGGYIEPERLVELAPADINHIVVKLSNENINKYIVRALDDEKTLDQNLLDLEKAIDDHQMDYSRLAKSMTYGPEVLMNYIISKEAEIKNLRIILVSKLNSLPKEFTLERLRETYA
ncbi:V-type ATPase subunit [Anaerococcus sp. mt242]|uniref:V-type ATPase subunit n=1 Tax=Anaerococcus sp. mt242 TaxID=2661917 RepID=UPI0019331DFA|nr:V-type ATPase subunit [Anaerococcus sp. mt242]MBM0046251.1 V-type ATPase subunit [Anaerococcus sp. mt242]